MTELKFMFKVHLSQILMVHNTYVHQGPRQQQPVKITVDLIIDGDRVGRIDIHALLNTNHVPPSSSQRR